MKVHVLMTQWKDGNYEIAGVFSSFDKAVAYFVRTMSRDATMSVMELQSEAVKVALKMAHVTDDKDFADFGNTRAWVEEHEIDAHCWASEKEARDDR